MHWLPDLIGWSTARDSVTFFGNLSSWGTTFSLPILLTALIAWWKIRKDKRIAGAFVIILLFSGYMSLGPSLKYNATNVGNQDFAPDGGMSAKRTILPTGSAVLSQYIPGFKNMRVSFRWLVLSVAASWLLLVLLFASNRKRQQQLAVILALLVLVLNMPNLPRKWKIFKHYQGQPFSVDTQLLPSLEKDLHKGELVAFVPTGNDCLVNYIASRLDIHSYNTGGDKNLIYARNHWPPLMKGFSSRIDHAFVRRILTVLALKEAVAVVLPYYFNNFSSLANWDSAGSFEYPVLSYYFKNISNIDHWNDSVHLEFNKALRRISQELELYKRVTITKSKYYSVIRLKKDLDKMSKR
jgi:hypothetical protein